MKTKTRTRLLSLLLTLAMMLTSFAVVIPTSAAPWDGSAATAFDSGTGTAEDPYVIKTAGQLKYFADTINAGTTNYAGEYVVLGADIDLGAIEFAPIGTYEKVRAVVTPPAEEGGEPTTTYTTCFFEGTFDGQGYSITNAKVVGTTSANGQGIGFFRQVNNAVIKNLTLALKDADFGYETRRNDQYIGGLVGATFGTIEMSNVTVTGNFKAGAEQRPNMGPIVGSIRGTKSVFVDCYTNAVVDIWCGSTTTRLGGMFGSSDSTAAELVFINCVSEATVNFDGLDWTGSKGMINVRVGGILGIHQSKPVSTTIIACDGFNAEFNGLGASLNAYSPIVGDTQNAPTIIATRGETTSAKEYAFSTITLSSCKEGVMAVKAAVEGGKYTLTLHADTLAFLQSAYQTADDPATEDVVEETIISWAVKYNGVALTGTLNEAGEMVYTADAVEGVNAVIDLNGAPYNVKANETYSKYVTSNKTIFSKGTGTAEDPFVISNEWQFYYFVNSVTDSNNYTGQYIVLEKDLNMIDLPLSVFHKDSTFSGIFDGQGHVVKDIILRSGAGGDDYAGMFSILGNGATFKNVVFDFNEKTMVGATTGGFGGIAGQSVGATVFHTVKVTGDITYVGCKDSNTGAFLGTSLGNTTFINCYADINMEIWMGANTIRVGGFIGMTNTENMNLYFINCVSYFNVTHNGGKNHRMGGFVGVFQKRIADVFFVGCESAWTRSGPTNGSVGFSDYVGYSNNITHMRVYDTPAPLTKVSFLGGGKCDKMTFNMISRKVVDTDTTVTVTIPYTTIEKILGTGYTVSFGQATSTKATNPDASETWTFTKVAGDTTVYPTIHFNGFDYLLDGFEIEYDNWQAYASDGLSGSGTVMDPYLLDTPNDWAYLALQVALGNTFEGVQFSMSDDTDVVIDGKQWIPIGSYGGTPFMGSIDGNSYGGASLTVVFEDKDVSTSTGVELFGWIVNAEVMYLDANFVYNDIHADPSASGALTSCMTNSYVGDCNFTIDGKITTGKTGTYGMVAINPFHWEEDLSGSTSIVENVSVTGQFEIVMTSNAGDSGTCYFSPFFGNTRENIEAYNCTSDVDLVMDQKYWSSTVDRYGGLAVFINDSKVGDVVYSFGMTVENYVNTGSITLLNQCSTPRIGGLVGDLQGGGWVVANNILDALDLNIEGNTNLGTYYYGGVIGWYRAGTATKPANPTVISNVVSKAYKAVANFNSQPYADATTVTNYAYLGVGEVNGTVYANAEAWELLQEFDVYVEVVYDGEAFDDEPVINEANNTAAFAFEYVEGAEATIDIMIEEAYEDIDGNPVDLVASFKADTTPDWTLFAASAFASGTGAAYVPEVPAVPAVPEVPAVGVEGEEGYIPGTPAIPEVPAIPAIEADPYVIETPAQMARMMLLLNPRYASLNKEHSLDYRRSNYVLAADLDMGLFAWAPIQETHGTISLTGSFIFDGAGYTISNVNIDGSYHRYGASMFGRLDSGAQLLNLNVDGLTIADKPAGALSVNGVVGLVNALYNSTVDNCHVTGLEINQTTVSEDIYVAGLVAYMTEGAVLSNSTVEGVINATVGGTNAKVGGLVARVGNSATIKNCQADVEINVIAQVTETGSNAGLLGVGGILGMLNADAAEQTLTLTDATFTGTVAVDYVGVNTYGGAAGAIGLIRQGTANLNNVVVTEEVVLTKTETATNVVAGGIIGWNTPATTVLTNAIALNNEALVGKNAAAEELITTASVAGILGLETLEGARVRIDPEDIENSGLRFDNYVDEDTFYALADAGFIVYVGTAITTTDRLAAVDGDWAALEDDVDKLTVDANDFVEGGDYNFTGAIININEENYDKEFVATAYITIVLVEGQEATEDTEAVEEVSITLYADSNVVRSVKEVATLALADETATYTEAQLAILKAYVGA